MSDVVIRVEDLSKHYRLGQISGGTLREDLQSWWAGVRGKEDPLLEIGAKPRTGSGEHWALKDVSFDVRQGEVLGIIGRNGAGKSTLLKILSRTTAPTKGSVRIKGRVGSLLEVGTGFHPELSGRENIYLNGTILGMRKAEIDRKLDEIIDFSEVEKFIDTPVKRYSSGMYVRLAFAVAAHLEPEILIVDEVLAVGDVEFQKKCLGKMHDVSRRGRTVLFVSHNMSAISSLCSQAVLLEQGSIACHDVVDIVLNHYFHETEECQGVIEWPAKERPGNDSLRLVSVAIEKEELLLADGNCKKVLSIQMELEAADPVRNVEIGVMVSNSAGLRILHTATCVKEERLVISAGRSNVRYQVPIEILRSGVHSVSISAAIPNQYFIFELLDFMQFNIDPQLIKNSVHPEIAWTGVISPQAGEWIL